MSSAIAAIRRVEDRQDPYQPRGKPSPSGLPHGTHYYCTTGIWQTVWLEPVPAIRIGELKITPHAQAGQIELMVYRQVTPRRFAA